MSEMRKLLNIVEGVETDENKQKLDEHVIGGGMAEVPGMAVGDVSEDRSREEYETHITKGSYAPHNPMGDVQMEDDEEEDDIEVVSEEITDSDDSEVDSDDSEDEGDELEESTEPQVDPEIAEWMKRLER